MNLASFAEGRGASSMVMVQSRDHCQKNEFKRLFKVLDAKRVGKKGMKEMMNEDHILEYITKYSLYQVDLN